MRSTRKATALLGATAALALAFSGAAGAAPESGVDSRIPGNFVGWEDPGYSGSLYINVSPSNCSSCEIDGWDGDNEISSVKNKTSCTVRLYADDGWGGGAVDVPAGEWVWNLERLGFDNEAESLKFLC